MKRNLQKTLITIACILCSIGVFAYDFEMDGIYYEIRNSDEVKVSYRGSSSDSYNNEYTGSVVIPEKVTYNNTTYSVTSIGWGAFEGCTGLTEITIPNLVKVVSRGIFAGCESLETLILGTGIDKFREVALRGCDAIKTIYVPAEKADCYKRLLPNNLHPFIVELEPMKKAKKI